MTYGYSGNDRSGPGGFGAGAGGGIDPNSGTNQGRSAGTSNAGYQGGGPTSGPSTPSSGFSGGGTQSGPGGNQSRSGSGSAPSGSAPSGSGSNAGGREGTGGGPGGPAGTGRNSGTNASGGGGTATPSATSYAGVGAGFSAPGRTAGAIGGGFGTATGFTPDFGVRRAISGADMASRIGPTINSPPSVRDIVDRTAFNVAQGNAADLTGLGLRADTPIGLAPAATATGYAPTFNTARASENKSMRDLASLQQSYRDTAANMETGGVKGDPYGKVHPDGISYGKYGIHRDNIADWTKDVLGKRMTPQQFLNDPKAQDAVFDAKFGAYVGKFGSIDAAARAWHGGEDAVDSPRTATYGREFAQQQEAAYNQRKAMDAANVPTPTARPGSVQSFATRPDIAVGPGAFPAARFANTYLGADRLTVPGSLPAAAALAPTVAPDLSARTRFGNNADIDRAISSNQLNPGYIGAGFSSALSPTAPAPASVPAGPVSIAPTLNGNIPTSFSPDMSRMLAPPGDVYSSFGTGKGDRVAPAATGKGDRLTQPPSQALAPGAVGAGFSAAGFGSVLAAGHPAPDLTTRTRMDNNDDIALARIGRNYPPSAAVAAGATPRDMDLAQAKRAEEAASIAAYNRARDIETIDAMVAQEGLNPDDLNDPRVQQERRSIAAQMGVDLDNPPRPDFTLTTGSIAPAAAAAGTPMSEAEKQALTTSHQEAAETMMKAGILGVGKQIETTLQPIVDRIIGVESANNPKAKNPLSSAEGLGQFIDSTWLGLIDKYPELNHLSKADKLALKTDPTWSEAITMDYAKQNVQALSKAGIAITPATVYAAHFLGPAGAKAAYRADPNASAVSVLGADKVAANPSVMQGKTIGQVIDYIENKMAPISAGGDGGGLYPAAPAGSPDDVTPDAAGNSATPATSAAAPTGLGTATGPWGVKPEGPIPGQKYPDEPMSQGQQTASFLFKLGLGTLGGLPGAAIAGLDLLDETFTGRGFIDDAFASLDNPGNGGGSAYQGGSGDRGNLRSTEGGLAQPATVKPGPVTKTTTTAAPKTTTFEATYLDDAKYPTPHEKWGNASTYGAREYG